MAMPDVSGMFSRNVKRPHSLACAVVQVLPELSQRLSSRIAARFVRELYT